MTGQQGTRLMDESERELIKAESMLWDADDLIQGHELDEAVKVVEKEAVELHQAFAEQEKVFRRQAAPKN